MDIDLTELARKGIQAELVRLDTERRKLETLLASLRSTGARPASTVQARPRRTMSEDGRERIREAVRRRWERVRAAAASANQAVNNAEEASASTAAPRTSSTHSSWP